MTILEWAKANAKDGANFAELEELVERENPINGVKTATDAEVFIRNNAVLQSYFDSSVSKAVDAHDKKFMDEKLPSVLDQEREKIRKELNPEETDEQKEIRRLREEMDRQKLEIDNERLRTKLMSKAAELSIPEEMANRYSVFGEEALAQLENLSIYIDERVNSGVEEGVKAKFKGRKDPGSGKPTGARSMARADFDVLDPGSKAAFLKDGGILE